MSFNLPYLCKSLRTATLTLWVLGAIAPQLHASTFVSPGISTPDITGGSHRCNGLCPGDRSGEILIPLIPDTHHGYTVSDNPTIFVYVPETSASEAYFSLQDDSDNPLFAATVPVPEGGGLVAVSIPDSAPRLEAGQEYRWYFTLKCNGRLRPDYPLVGGLMSRYDGEVSVQGSPVEVADAYGRAGIWYDGLAALMLALAADPDSTILQANLEEFLNSAGLYSATSDRFYSTTVLKSCNE